MSLLLLLIYPFAIQIERGGIFLVLAPITGLALLIDVIANYTELALITRDWPARGEWTFSTRCKRLQYYDTPGGAIARWTKSYCNHFAPSGKHI